MTCLKANKEAKPSQAMQQDTEDIPPPPPPPPPGQALEEHGDDDLVNDSKFALTSESQWVALASLPLMLCGWGLLYVPLHFQSAPVLILFGIWGVLLLALGVRVLLTRPQLTLPRESDPLQVFIIQMMTWILLSHFMWMPQAVMLLPSKVALVYFNTSDATQFQAQLDALPHLGWYDFFGPRNLWSVINTQFFIVSFSIFLLINTPTELFKAAQTSPVCRQIMTFELTALIYPMIHILAPFLLLNLYAEWTPAKDQTLRCWIWLHILTYIWIGLELYGVWEYPEIPLARPLGPPGYLYMMHITTAQGFFITTLLLLTFSVGVTIATLVPGVWTAYMDNRHEPMFFTRALFYFQQIQDGLPAETWKYQTPYPNSLDLVAGTFFVVSYVRNVNLTKYSKDLLERWQNAEETDTEWA